MPHDRTRVSWGLYAVGKGVLDTVSKFLPFAVIPRYITGRYMDGDHIPQPRFRVSVYSCV